MAARRPAIRALARLVGNMNEFRTSALLRRRAHRSRHDDASSFRFDAPPTSRSPTPNCKASRTPAWSMDTCPRSAITARLATCIGGELSGGGLSPDDAPAPGLHQSAVRQPWSTSGLLYAAAHTAAHDDLLREGFALRAIGSVEALERWQERRASWRHGRYPRPGTGESTQAALAAAQGCTVICSCCAALVHLQAARRAARRAGRSSWSEGSAVKASPPWGGGKAE